LRMGQDQEGCDQGRKGELQPAAPAQWVCSS
jgi:hypothetical protein